MKKVLVRSYNITPQEWPFVEDLIFHGQYTGTVKSVAQQFIRKEVASGSGVRVADFKEFSTINPTWFALMSSDEGTCIEGIVAGEFTTTDTHDPALPDPYGFPTVEAQEDQMQKYLSHKDLYQHSLPGKVNQVLDTL